MLWCLILEMSAEDDSVAGVLGHVGQVPAGSRVSK